MKKQNENGRISEDRLNRANKRKKNNTIASILVMTGCLLVLVLVTYVAGILYSWIDSKFQDNAMIWQQQRKRAVRRRVRQRLPGLIRRRKWTH